MSSPEQSGRRSDVQKQRESEGNVTGEERRRKKKNAEEGKSRSEKRVESRM